MAFLRSSAFWSASESSFDASEGAGGAKERSDMVVEGEEVGRIRARLQLRRQCAIAH